MIAKREDEEESDAQKENVIKAHDQGIGMHWREPLTNHTYNARHALNRCTSPNRLWQLLLCR
jgi:hypothetical protein